jgi:hypothetical protein
MSRRPTGGYEFTAPGGSRRKIGPRRVRKLNSQTVIGGWRAHRKKSERAAPHVTEAWRAHRVGAALFTPFVKGARENSGKHRGLPPATRTLFPVLSCKAYTAPQSNRCPQPLPCCGGPGLFILSGAEGQAGESPPTACGFSRGTYAPKPILCVCLSIAQRPNSPALASLNTPVTIFRCAVHRSAS